MAPQREESKRPRGGEVMVMGGINWPAVFTGWVVAFFTGLIFSAVVAAVISGLGLTPATSTLGGIAVASGVSGLVIWFLSFFLGGWTAARIAGFNGLQQGLMVWLVGVVFLILMLILAGIIGPGAALLGGIRIPAVGNIAATVSIASAILLAVQLVGSLIGGWLGTRTQRM